MLRSAKRGMREEQLTEVRPDPDIDDEDIVETARLGELFVSVGFSYFNYLYHVLSY